MSDQLDVLKLLAARLDGANLPYMITGSIAAGLYGQPRMTRDIDIVAVLYPPHATMLADLLGREFVCDVETELQFRDVRSIIALQPDLDWPYMERWALRLTVARLLAELRG